MTPLFRTLVLSVLILSTLCFEVAAASTQKFIADDYPPYNYLNETGEMVGISVEILNIIMPKIIEDFSTDDIVQLPWARAYQQLQESTNITLFTMLKTKEREKLFKFIGPISSSNLVVISKNANLQIDTLDDLASYRVAVVRDGLGDHLTQTMSTKKLSTIRLMNRAQVVKLLINDRVDAAIVEQSSITYHLKTFGESPQNYHPLYSMNHSGTYFAFNKNVDSAFFSRFQSEFAKLKKNGTIGQIYQQYMDSL